MKAIRIQRKRTKGWKMPENTVYVGRGSVWGNPFKVGVDGTAEECVQKYIARAIPYQSHANGTIDDLLSSRVNIDEIVDALRGKNLACWCPLDQTCHADVLLRIANQG